MPELVHQVLVVDLVAANVFSHRRDVSGVMTGNARNVEAQLLRFEHLIRPET